MSQYLDLAEFVLRAERRPLTARQILGAAFRNEVIPPDLYGKTQHKTLQARISEDILHYKENSRFYRTARGVFFLREFLNSTDVSAPEEIKARRRILDLRFKGILSVQGVLGKGRRKWVNSRDQISLGIKNGFTYQDFADSSSGTTRLWAGAIITKEGSFLTYRRGSFREDRDDFLNQRSIAFFAPLTRRDRDLFSQEDEGLRKAVIEVTSMDLDMPLQSGWTEASTFEPFGCLLSSATSDIFDALMVIRVLVPSWFDPPRQKLSINDLMWTDLRAINDLDDFEPWSREIILRLAKTNELARTEEWRIG